MADFHFGTVAVYDPISDTVMENLVGGVLVQVKDGPPLTIYDLSDNQITQITSGPSGMSSQFGADVPTGLIQFGNVCVTVWANELGDQIMEMLATSQAAADAAAQAQAAVENMLGTGPRASIISVNGNQPDGTGDLALTPAMINLGNVDNTADVNKAVSTQQQAAIDLAKNRANQNGRQDFLSSTSGQRVAFSTNPASNPPGADVDTLVIFLTPTKPTAVPPGEAFQVETS
jgi:hypothetical protein